VWTSENRAAHFALYSNGWGSFDLEALIHYSDGTTTLVEHYLDLGEEWQETHAAALLEAYDAGPAPVSAQYPGQFTPEQQEHDPPNQRVLSLRAIQRELVEAFDISELRLLCLELGVNYNLFDDDTKPLVAMNIVRHFAREGSLPRLVAAIQSERPGGPFDPYQAPEQENTNEAAQDLPSTEAIRAALTRHFDLRELRLLCFDLGIDFDDLGVGSLVARASGLVAACEREGQLDRLVAEMRRARPGIQFEAAHSQQPSTPEEASASELTSPAILALLREHFNRDDLRLLCADLGIDFEDLADTGLYAKKRELVQYCERRGRLPELASAMRAMMPGLFDSGTGQAPSADPA
jgi:hypothetical protein